MIDRSDRSLSRSSSAIDQIDHDLDHLVPHLPLLEVVQDLHIQYRSNPGNMCQDHAGYTAPTGQNDKLDHTRSGIESDLGKI